MSKRQRLMALLVVALCSRYVCTVAQTFTVRVMTLEEIYRLADEESRSIRTYRTGVEAAEQSVKAAKAQRMPDISASVSLSYLGDGWLSDRDFGNGMHIDMPHLGNNFALEASQVIYSGGAISSGIRLAELSKQMAELDSRKNRQEVRFLLTGYYLDLYKLSNQEQVLLKNLELTEQVIRNMEARLREGTVLKSDITRYELQRESLKLQLAGVQDACRIMNHQLVTTLHLPTDTRIVADTTLLSREVPVPTEEEWQLMARQSNVGLQQASVAARISEQQVKLERSEQLPKVALVAAEHLDGPITIEVPTLDNNFNYWYVGVGVRYNLSSLFKNNKKVRQARLNARRAQEEASLAEEQVDNAVQACYTNFLTAFTDLRTQEKSVELANQNYNVTSNRYLNDLALLTDMLDASNMKLSADLGLVNARINVIYHYYKMKYVTHTL